MLTSTTYNRATIVPGKSREMKGLTGGVFDSNGELIAASLLIRNSAPVINGSAALASRRHLQGEFLFGGYAFNEFGHFLLESCSRLWLTREKPGIPVIWILGSRLLDYQEQILDILGVRGPHLFLPEPTSVDVLHIPQPGYRIPDFFSPAHAEFMGVWDRPGDAGPEKVWLSRSGLPEDRGHIYSEPRIEELLRSNGWEIFDPGASAVALQLDLICGAKHVAGFMGSAFHSLVLARQPSAKITIFTRGRRNANYGLIAKTKRLDQSLHELALVSGVARGHKTSHSLANPNALLSVLGVKRVPPSFGATDPVVSTKPQNHSARRINALVKGLGAETYLEIGVALGSTFSNVSASDKTAVDPSFRFDYAAQISDHVRFYEMPSDEFFAYHAGNDTFDLVFLDGLHTFEQTFRDFCCSLGHASNRTVWLIDDTVPKDVYSAWRNPAEAVALRTQDGGKGADWHGDVYKIVFAIHDFFPTMSYCTIATGGNAQTVVWYQPRRDFKPLFNSLEAISRLSWFDMRLKMEWFNKVDERTGLATVISTLQARKTP